MDLVKIDRKIHHQEVMFLGDLQKTSLLNDDELELSRYLSTQQAIDILKSLSIEDRKKVSSFLDSLIKIDNHSDKSEKILLSAIKVCLDEDSCLWSKVVSVNAKEVDYTSSQIIYLEKTKRQDIHSLLKDNNTWLLLQKSFDDVDLEFFYLPRVIDRLKLFIQKNEYNNREDLKQSLEIFFNKKHLVFEDIDTALDSLSVTTFYKLILSNYNISHNVFPDAFLLLRIQEEYVYNDDNNAVKMQDFLCIDVSQNIKDRILHYVSSFDNPICEISYDGYYKFLFDYVCVGSKITSSVLFDENYNVYLKDLDNLNITFESSPQSKTFYLLLLKNGLCGVSQKTFDDASRYLECLDLSSFTNEECFDVELFKNNLLSNGTEYAVMIYNTVCIYETLSTKDSYNDNFLTYIYNIIKYRSSLKNYINNTFSSISALNNIPQYCIQYNKQSKSYYVPLDLSYFSVCENEREIMLSESILWKKLK